MTPSHATAPFFHAFKDIDMNEFDQMIILSMRIALLGTIVLLGFCVTPGILATISRNVVDADIAITAMWSIGRPADTLRNWLAALRCSARGRSVN
jgi:hypothetical protein